MSDIHNNYETLKIEKETSPKELDKLLQKELDKLEKHKRCLLCRWSNDRKIVLCLI